MILNNPIAQRELTGILRTRSTLISLTAIAAVFALLVLARWPSDAHVGLSGTQARQVFSVFGYGLLAISTIIVPVFPATGIVRERHQGTLALLLNSGMSAFQILLGKMTATTGMVVLLLMVSLPAAAACYAMGGQSLSDLTRLYTILFVLGIQYSALGLLISAIANSTESALRLTYGAVLTMAVLVLAPHFFLRGMEGSMATAAAMLQHVSPVPAVMQILGHSDTAAQGALTDVDATIRYLSLAAITTSVFVIMTLRRLNYSIFDRDRSAGVITDDLGGGAKAARRLFFLIDPQRRKAGIAPFFNPVMVKEFRSRKFGRFHWLIRMISGCALTSLGLSWIATMGTMDWGVETIGAIIVVLQMALIVLFAPSLASGLVSSERESGGWDLLRMTPLSAGAILRGKLLSVIWTLALVLCATLPGYAFMIYIKPVLEQQILQVIGCLMLTAVFAILLSACISSFFQRTAAATAASYGILVTICAGTLLFWLGRDAPFGHSTVKAALSINPLAAAFSAIGTPGFSQYDLVPVNWWITGTASVVLFLILWRRVRYLCRPR